MATKDITDLQVCLAVETCRLNKFREWPYDLLAEQTGQHTKVCYRAMQRAAKRGYLDYGVSLRTAWLTNKGLELLKEKP